MSALISPGFVRTQLTDKNDFKMPALLEPEEAARRIADGLQRRAFDINFPRRLSWPLKLLGGCCRVGCISHLSGSNPHARSHRQSCFHSVA